MALKHKNRSRLTLKYFNKRTKPHLSAFITNIQIMQKKIYILFFLFSILFNQYIKAEHRFSLKKDSVISNINDSIKSNIYVKPDSIVYTYDFIDKNGKFVNDSILNIRLDSLIKLPIKKSESLLYQSNDLFAPLIYHYKKPQKLKIPKIDNLGLFSQEKEIVTFLEPQKAMSTESCVEKLRSDFRDILASKDAGKYSMTSDELPQTNTYQTQSISSSSIGYIPVTEELPNPGKDRIKTSEIKKMHWQKKINALFQFSENYISPNWYQGGNSNLALLSVFTGKFSYDNLKNIQWENNAEWHVGFNSVVGDTLRKIATNDDVLRLTSKFSIKAFGDWSYTILGEASTQFFNNYKAVNSNVIKASLFTPIRTNIGLGMSYKYKKILSLVISPATLKYIYVKDSINVDPNLFGIEKGQNHITELGSSVTADISYSPMYNWQITSRYTFFTNYRSIETNWEIVNLFDVNRFISTRLSLNPRFDNTVIETNGEKARIQFKQLLSIGLSLRLL